MSVKQTSIATVKQAIAKGKTLNNASLRATKLHLENLIKNNVPSTNGFVDSPMYETWISNLALINKVMGV